MTLHAQTTTLLPKDTGGLSQQDYERIRKLVYDKTGINLGDHKQQLVRARLGRRLRRGHFNSYRDYYEHIRKDNSGCELNALIDAISTNTTHLFRERQHFDFLAQTLQKRCAENAHRPGTGNLRIWSAGCSSGEEPYSIAMIVDDVLRERHGCDWRLLATDISTRVLERAHAGIFDTHCLETVPAPFRQRYFTKCHGHDSTHVQIAPALRQKITFARFNLMTEQFPFRNGFDFIFCRNVMIYFDRSTQQTLVAKFAEHLRPAGYLLIGHAESLNNITHTLRYIRPAVYQRSV